MKDFKKWCDKKVSIHKKEKFGFPKNREIWWASIGVNIGHEQDGIGHLYERPVLIVKKFPNNTCLVIPLTKSGKNTKFYYKLLHEDTLSYLALTQVRTVSSKRLNRNIRRLIPKEFNEIIIKMKAVNGIK